MGRGEQGCGKKDGWPTDTGVRGGRPDGVVEAPTYPRADTLGLHGDCGDSLAVVTADIVYFPALVSFLFRFFNCEGFLSP